jgi:hypothetical protein
MFSAQHVRQFVHILFNERLEIEHHARTALRVHCRPGWLRLLRRRHGQIEHSFVTQSHASLHAAIIGVHDIAKP